MELHSTLLLLPEANGYEALAFDEIINSILQKMHLRSRTEQYFTGIFYAITREPHWQFNTLLFVKIAFPRSVPETHKFELFLFSTIHF